MIKLDNKFKEKVMLAANVIHMGDPLKDVLDEDDIHWLIKRAAESFEGAQMDAQNRRCDGHTGTLLESDYCSKCGGYLGPD